MLAFAPVGSAFGSTLLGLVDTGELFVSGDGGASWAVRATLPVHDAVAIAAGTTALDLVIVSGTGVVYRSSDGGSVWLAAGATGSRSATDLLIEPSGRVLVLDQVGWVHASVNGGSSFTAIAALTGSDWASLARGADGRLYALGRSGAIAESADLGQSWAVVGALAIPDGVRLRARGAVLHVLTTTGDLFTSTDHGRTWAAVGTLSQVGMRGLVDDGAGLVAASREGHVARSADGAIWWWEGSMNQWSLTGLGTDAPATTRVGDGRASGALALAPPWPNPVRPGERLRLRLATSQAGVLRVALYDLAGRRVVARHEPFLAPGDHVVELEAPALAAGLYVVRVASEAGASASARVVLAP
jgi:hypothetical protein